MRIKPTAEWQVQTAGCVGHRRLCEYQLRLGWDVSGFPWGFLPFANPILTVSGEVFDVPKVSADALTDDLVQQVHTDFCRALRNLFDTYKKVYVEEMGAGKEWLARELKFEDEC